MELAACDIFSQDFRGGLRDSFMNSGMRKISMSQNDPEEQNPVMYNPVELFVNSEEGKENQQMKADVSRSEENLIMLTDDSQFLDQEFAQESPTFPLFKEQQDDKPIGLAKIPSVNTSQDKADN
jgi:hypothetical protein